jgi:hypothetical protein
MRDASPAISIPPGRSIIFVLLALGGGVVAAAGLFFFDPAQHGFYPRCFFKLMTGLDCPGCGGLRATHQLLHGHVGAAMALNPLFIVSIPVGAFFVCRALYEKAIGRASRRFLSHTASVCIGGIIVIAFGVLRNLPWRVWFGT